jgi:hypothetical protein
MEDKKDKTEAEEPEYLYQKTKMRFFSSFKEAEEYDAEENAKLSPIEHLQIANVIISNIFKEELKNLTKPYTKITFTNNEYLP